jgi:thiosulfate/3-mercaptopyruvate sulfurtransferase
MRIFLHEQIGFIEGRKEVKNIMNKKVVMATLTLLVLFTMIPLGHASFFFRPGIVSTDWLKLLLDLGSIPGDFVLLDDRSPESYAAGHIPGAINVPEGMWYINPPFGPDLPWMQMPSEEDLFELIGNAGITRYSWVIVIGSTSGPLAPMPVAFYNAAGITRVAITLLYAGVEYVSILDGGFEKWAAEGKPVSADPVTPIPVTYKGTLKNTMLVSADYVESKIGKSMLFDARDEIVYNGTVTEPWAPDPGHISTAKNLPAPTLWNVKEDGQGNAVYITYKSFWTLFMMVLNAADWTTGGWINQYLNWHKEIIVYCGVGGYASTVYFVLTRVLWYCGNVRLYDGSVQEWNGMLGKPLVT